MRRSAATTLQTARLRPVLLAVVLASLSLSFLGATSLLWQSESGSATRAVANMVVHGGRSSGARGGKGELETRARAEGRERLLDEEQEQSTEHEDDLVLTKTAAPTPTPTPTPTLTPTSLNITTTTPILSSGKPRPAPTRLDAASGNGGPQRYWAAPTPLPTVLGKPPPIVNGVDPLFPPVKLFPLDAAIHNESFVSRSHNFDTTVSRDKGIILCLHDGVFALGLSLIRELRCLGNTELIQVYHCLPQDLSYANKEVLVSQDDRLEIIDVCSDLVHANVLTSKQAATFKSYWIKPLAVHHTNLKELILLDADDILLRDPSFLRDNQLYRENGTLFFYDRVINQPWFFSTRMKQRGFVQLLKHIVAHIDYAAFNISNHQPSQYLLSSFAYQARTCHEMDSSMVLIDKTRAGKAMDVLWYLIAGLRVGFEFSWGDKEAFWFAFELAQQPYAFTPWGVSVVSSSTNRDMETHPDTLCGSIAQYVPSNASTPAEVLYINGRALLDPLTQGTTSKNTAPNLLYNANPTHVVPRMKRMPSQVRYAQPPLAIECLVGLGSTPLPEGFQRLLFRRRLHFLAAASGAFASLSQCEFPWR